MKHNELQSPVRAFISVGANIDPERNILSALAMLADRVALKNVSMFHRTPALKRPEQPDYLNGVAEIQCALPARALKFEVLRGIEAALGRVRTADAYAARPIDLDILLYDDVVTCEDDLTIPDPDLLDRPFLAVPLLELAPDLIMPDSGRRLADCATARDREQLTPAPAFTNELKARLSL